VTAQALPVQPLLPAGPPRAGSYGLSPGDAGNPRPYAYVGPWTPREGAFWNVAFGALRRAGDLPDAGAVAAFFAEGRTRAHQGDGATEV